MMVGGSIPSRIASRHESDSMAPAAPRKGSRARPVAALRAFWAEPGF